MVLSAGNITPNTPAIDDGQSVNLTAHASGGSGTNSFAWYRDSIGTGACDAGTSVAGGASGILTTAPLSRASGPYFYCYVVTNSTLATASSAWDQVVVNPALTAPAAPSVSATSLDRDQPLSVLAKTPTNGTAPYDWQWLVSVNGAAAGSTGLCAKSSGLAAPGGTSETCAIAGGSLTSGSSYRFKFEVTDNSTTREQSTSSFSGSVYVNSTLGAPGTPTVSSTALDVDQTLNVTGVLPSSGTAPYNWTWLVSTNGGTYTTSTQCAVNSGTGAPASATKTCSVAAGVLTASDSYSFELQARDSAQTPETQNSPPSPVVAVAQALVAGSASPSGVALDAGQSVVLTASASGGTGPYSYRWYSATTGTGVCTSGTIGASGANESVAPTANRYYCYTVTDSATTPTTVSSSWVLVKVSPALTSPAAPTVSAAALDSDQSLTVSGTIPTSGTATYSWQWRLSTNAGAYTLASVCAAKSGSAAAAGAAVTCAVPAGTLSVGSSYAFELRVADNATTTETRTSAASPTIVVGTPLAAPSAPVPSATALDADQPLYVNATLPSTGTAPYTWQWLASVGGGAYSSASECGSTVKGAGATGGSSVSCAVPGGTLAASTSYTFELEVGDNASTPETQTSAPSANVSTSSTLTAGTPSPMTVGLDLGQSVTLATDPSGGAGGYVYQWYSGNSASGCSALGSPISGASAPTLVASPTVTTYFCYTVTDATSNQAISPSNEVVVNPALTAPAPPLPSTSSWLAGTSLNVTATLPSNGTPTYAWQWLVSVNGSASVDAAFCAVSSGAGAPGGAQVVCSVLANARSAGASYAFVLQVTDSAATPESATSSPSGLVLTAAALSAGPPTPTSPTIDRGQSIVLAAQAAGGSGSYAYQWYSGNSSAGCLGGTFALAGATLSTYSASPTSSTYYCYRVSDVGAGANASGSVLGGPSLVTVDSALVSPTAPTTSGTTLSTGASLTITATIPSTGTAPYAWTWLVSLNGGPWVPASGCGTSTNGTGALAGSTETCRLSAAQLAGGGSYSFALGVTDSSAVPSTVISPPTAAVTVGGSGPGGSAGGFPTADVAIAVAVTIAAVLVLLLLLGRRHPRSRPHARPHSHPAPLTSWDEGPPPAPAARSHPPERIEAPTTVLDRPSPTVVPLPSPVPAKAVIETEAPPTPPARPPVSELNDLDSVLGELDRIRDDMTRRPHRKEGEGPESDGSSSEGRER